MRATGEIQVIPIGVGVSLGTQVKRAHEIIAQSSLLVELHGQGTNVEGELADILATVRKIHEVLHAEGVPRLSVSVKLGTRLDKTPSLDAKVRAVRGD